ncbi:hypothetical protein DL95DRAFT_512381 [Leptodontidium sp. 2 PMI_412]|nr:hypothetical protein DL95DRAFT_512381 [Leptodontidium sp. 2 PMI_412]
MSSAAQRPSGLPTGHFNTCLTLSIDFRFRNKTHQSTSCIDPTAACHHCYPIIGGFCGSSEYLFRQHVFVTTFLGPKHESKVTNNHSIMLYPEANVVTKTLLAEDLCSPGMHRGGFNILSQMTICDDGDRSTPRRVGYRNSATSSEHLVCFSPRRCAGEPRSQYRISSQLSGTQIMQSMVASDVRATSQLWEEILLGFSIPSSCTSSFGLNSLRQIL